MQQVLYEFHRKEDCIYNSCEGLGIQCFQVLLLSKNQVSYLSI